ncbi:tryptophan synthase subunit alpha [Marinihelvus fidelis]|uniref:Tryptophan synthase alpha chain n=1 Tax=Marinihelvus fidelis TaxID=2613842 RepID=A0A5N0TAM2_9GAMM|nr:tryptophan synthase subunit alpha [Marinihelvus fidelis]
MDTALGARRQAGGKALVPFITAGDPEPGWTVDIMHALVAGGADLIELGVPFSDPMADGPVIQVASERAIARGVTLSSVLDMVADFRRDDPDTPVILMGYLNPVERLCQAGGEQAFAERVRDAGVDGLLLVDCPPEEGGALHQAMAGAAIDNIILVAPTTDPQRLEKLCAAANGFIYYVSFKGITGASRLDSAAVAEPVSRIRAHSELPVMAGFGISDAASAVAVAEHADGVVIGSALVRLLETADDAEEASRLAGDFVASVRRALDNIG